MCRRDSMSANPNVIRIFFLASHITRKHEGCFSCPEGVEVATCKWITGVPGIFPEADGGVTENRVAATSLVVDVRT